MKVSNFLRFILSAFFCTMLLGFAPVFGQTRVITGTVHDEMNEALPGVNILIKGTSSGSITDFDGKFSIEVGNGQNELVVSYIGYITKTIAIGTQSNVSIKMELDAEQLDEVVVTALGIERSERSLGYAVSAVTAEDMGDAGVASGNMMNSLSGKIAGVQIAPVSGAGSSSRVVIRGTANLNGNNQPLYIVDGVPIANNTFKDAGDSPDTGDVNTGDGLSSINPDDIESISVLKGGSATALYGSRAINGVILITTKSGKGKGAKSGVDFNTGVTLDVVGITPKDQTTYGQGIDHALAGNPKATTGMWGPKITGQRTDAYYDGKERTLQAYDNYNNFFKTGITSNTSVSAYTSNENSSLRFSYSNMDNQGMVDNSTYKRNTFNIRGTTSISKRLHIDGRLTYVNQKAHNRMEMGNSVNNYMGMLLGIPTTVDQNWLKDYTYPEGHPRAGQPHGYNDKETNPYWNMNRVVNEDVLNRVIGMASVTYDITDDLKILGRAGTDYNAMRQDVLQPLYTPWFEQGRAYQRTNLDFESNADFLLSYHKQVGNFDISANAGGAYMHQLRQMTDVGSSRFSSEDFQNPAAGSDMFQNFSTYDKSIASLYATASVGYKGFLFLDASIRNDWSSTLPEDNNSYFYPSISGTWVFSDMDWDTPDWLSFGKLRASWAQVGSDTDPYSLALQYELDNWDHNGMNIGGIRGNRIPNKALLPSIQTSYEFGIDIRFLNDRFGLDVARYSAIANNQILPVDISRTSGYESAIINAGEILNEGWEMSLNYQPIMNKAFNWSIDFNAAYNYNEVISLTEGVDYYSIGGVGGVNIQAIPGRPYGEIVAKQALRDDNGNFVVDSEGRIQVEDEPSTIGNGVQPWMAGIRNTFSYKNFTLSVLIDGKFGGDIYSSTEASMYASGKHEGTVGPRNEFIDGGFWNPGNLVTAHNDADGNVSYEPFTQSVDPQQYFDRYAGIPEFHLYDASFIKLREVSVSYMFPKTVLANTPIKNIGLTASAFNVGYLWRNTDNIDPEASFTSRNVQGIEYSNLAIPRTFTFKLNANF
ncbi:SusC/RagA family TonB-linked outer membrane protein [Flammeovirga sp. SubArs3]|uniref:SusC/RagA family TonB-linked outer membrane protein n=1 Tax=Flammeovirga sp. SubArs3 TaxID=2995316 RepID=UPI00248B8FEF|nr:SusC/RagA family TonB-linked outer membrane protein [Flammeovirga sp. SubArs3]